jgi:hypothetical protein
MTISGYLAGMVILKRFRARKVRSRVRDIVLEVMTTQKLLETSSIPVTPRMPEETHTIPYFSTKLTGRSGGSENIEISERSRKLSH